MSGAAFATSPPSRRAHAGSQGLPPWPWRVVFWLAWMVPWCSFLKIYLQEFWQQGVCLFTLCGWQRPADGKSGKYENHFSPTKLLQLRDQLTIYFLKTDCVWWKSTVTSRNCQFSGTLPGARTGSSSRRTRGCGTPARTCCPTTPPASYPASTRPHGMLNHVLFNMTISNRH